MPPGRYAELMAIPGVEFIPGGAGQNTARVTQWFLQSTPNAVVYAGCVGNDRTKEFQNFSIDTRSKTSFEVANMLWAKIEAGLE